MTNRKFRRMLSLLLTVCLCAALFAMPAYAQEDFTIYANGGAAPVAPIQTSADGTRTAGGDTGRVNYVSLGESFTNAFGYEDYYVVDDDPQSIPNEAGFGAFVAAKESYPYKLAQYYDADLTQLAVSSMRCEDLYATLDPEGFKASYISTIDPDGAADDGFAGPGDDYFNRSFLRSNGKYVDMARNLGYTGLSSEQAWSVVSDAYNTAVKGADVISLCIGLNNLGCYQLYRLSGALDPDAEFAYKFNDRINDAMQKEIDRDPLLKAQLKEMELVADIPELILCVASALGGSALDEALSGVTDQVMPLLRRAMDSLMYGYAGMCLNFKNIYNYIREVNPDAELILINQPNMLSGLRFGVNIDIGDSGKTIPVSIDIGNIWNTFILKSKAYINSVTAFDCHRVYLDFPDCATFIDQLKSFDGDLSVIDRDYLAAMIKLEFGQRVEKSFGVKLTDSRFHYGLADVMLELAAGKTPTGESYEANSAACLELYDDLLSMISIFGKAANLDFIDIPALMSGLERIGLGGNFGQEVMELIAEPGSEDIAYALAAIYAQSMLGDGLSIHPSDAGHTQIAERIIQSCPDFGGDTTHFTLLKLLQKAVFGNRLAIALQRIDILRPLKLLLRFI